MTANYSTILRYRTLALCGILILTACVIAQYLHAQDDIDSIIHQAEIAYLNADYETAISLYTSLINVGVKTEAVYFNLGNAYYESGDTGRGLLNFLRALEYAPRDIDINTNIALIRSRRVDVQDEVVPFTDNLTALTATTFRTNELGWMTFIAWTMWFMLASVAAIKHQWRSNLIMPLLIFGIIVLIAAILYGGRLYTERYRPAAVVVEETTPVLTGPDEQRYLKIFELHVATEVRILEENNGWIRFVLPDGRQGWIQRQSVEMV
ncbi:MAG: hypothetical protein CUN54_07695 [Phototrophicales bacterium]|nr:MAG: hypothetical protein CUN54_07695 [Phototrophicales bacterium]